MEGPLSAEEAAIIKDRAYAYLKNAKRLFEEAEYDLAAFSAEQFCQLLVKYKLLVETGTYPRTYSIVRLLRELETATSGSGLSTFIDAEILSLTRLEDAYIVSRYLPRRYERKEVEQLLAFAGKFKEAVENV